MQMIYEKYTFYNTLSLSLSIFNSLSVFIKPCRCFSSLGVIILKTCKAILKKFFI